MNPSPPVEQTSPEAEAKFHHYRSHEIPWYVHLIWVCFWLFCFWYILAFVFPEMRVELLTPP
jgi:hypothetical protein